MVFVAEAPGRLLMCLACDVGAADQLVQSAANLATEVMQSDQQASVVVTDLEDDFLFDSLSTYSGFSEVMVSHARVVKGPYAGMEALGAGPNIKLRTRVAKLALSIAVAMDYEGALTECVKNHFPGVSDMVEDARQTRTSMVGPNACRARMPLPAPPLSPGYPAKALPDLAPAPPAQMGISQGPRGPPTGALGGPPPPPPAPGLSPLPAAAVAVDAWQLSRDEAASRPPPHSSLVQYIRMGIPQECLEDPFMELRPWDGRNEFGGGVWPFCKICSCWSDLAHIHGQRHMKRRANNVQSPWPWGPPAASQPVPPRQWTGHLEAGGVEPVTYGSESMCALPAPPIFETKQAPPMPTDLDIWQWSRQCLLFDPAAVEGDVHTDTVET